MKPLEALATITGPHPADGEDWYRVEGLRGLELVWWRSKANARRAVLRELAELEVPPERVVIADATQGQSPAADPPKAPGECSPGCRASACAERRNAARDARVDGLVRAINALDVECLSDQAKLDGLVAELAAIAKGR